MKRPLGRIAEAFLVLALATGAATRAQAPTFTVLHSFTNTPDGAFPFGGLLIDASGDLYGTTISGGCTPYGCGTVFELDPAGNENVLSRFGIANPAVADPFGSLVRDSAGNFYGTSRDGGAVGNGTVFKRDTSGNLTVLHSFTCLDGVNPYAGLAIDAAGNLYGTAGAALGCGLLGGTVFKIDTADNFTVLHIFSGPDGAGPAGGVILDAAGNLYGTTGGGGTGACPDLAGFGAPCGTVFKIDTFGNETVLYSFKGGSDGYGPVAGLIMDAAGNLYGTTGAGGSGSSANCPGTLAPGCGTVFKLDSLGNETVLYSFKGGSDGAIPVAGVVMDAAGNLYGTTNQGGPGSCTGRNQVVVGCGTVFKLDPAGNETILHSFAGSSDGAFPLYGHLVMDTTGNLYGTASSFLALGGYGTVFKLTVQAPAPTITTISPASAIAGGPAFTLTVNGTNFVSGSTVNFNGTAVATTFVSGTQLTAAIPASDIATAGSFNVTVTNPGGGKSNAVSFTVVTPQEATQAIINSVNALVSQGVINGGQDNSLVVQLQHAIGMMDAGKNNGAIGNLDSFITEVNDLISSGILSASQAASLISAAQSVIAAL